MLAPAERETEFGLGSSHIANLQPYPTAGKGARTPFDLWRYGGRAGSSYTTPDLPMPWDEWVRYNRDRKPTLMAEIGDYMRARYDFSEQAIAGVFMSGGWKPVMAGPVARLPQGVASWEELAALPADEIRDQELFPYLPLAHPLQSTAHIRCFPSRGSRHTRNTNGSTSTSIFLMPIFRSCRRHYFLAPTVSSVT